MLSFIFSHMFIYYLKKPNYVLFINNYLSQLINRDINSSRIALSLKGKDNIINLYI